MSRYLDENRNIRPELLDEEAEAIARVFVGRGGISLSSSQMRRFYSEFKRIHTKFKTLKQETPNDAFAKVLPLIKLQRSRAAYASNASEGKTKIPRAFYKFLTENIQSISDQDEFDAFMLHFEAVVGFFYSMPGVRNN